jgi:menaquinone-specific isochorismate synthase
VTILPIHPAENASPDALRAFLEQCRAVAKRVQRPQLVSISLAVDALDPLAVLESIFESTEPHFYAERPASEMAIAGAEVAAAFEASGPTRFADVKRWVEETLANTIAVGDVAAPFGGPHFFSAFTFHDTARPDEAFSPAHVFVPRWQVARAGATTTAVANLTVSADADLDPLVERVWRAHTKFRRFEYRSAETESSESGTEIESGTGILPVSARSTGVPPVSKPMGEPPMPRQAKEPTGGASMLPQSTRTMHETGDYRAAVTRALDEISSGKLKKIVLARALDVVASRPFHPLEMLNGLRQRFPDCYAFSFTRGRGPSFIGATPERLVRISQGTLETEALAGSIRRGASASEDAALSSALQRSEKDRREQREVLDDIVARLTPLGLKPEYPAQPQVKRLANVQHLHTPIRAVVPNAVHALDVVAAMHPTPAVGGSPRDAAMREIPELEAFPRGLYAGVLGWLNPRGGAEFFVGIRSAVVEGDRARVFAGAGIVAGSSPEKEFAETELKARAMLDAFGT